MADDFGRKCIDDATFIRMVNARKESGAQSTLVISIFQSYYFSYDAKKPDWNPYSESDFPHIQLSAGVRYDKANAQYIKLQKICAYEERCPCAFTDRESDSDTEESDSSENWIIRCLLFRMKLFN